MVVGIIVLCVVFLLVAVLAQKAGGQAPKKNVVGAYKAAPLMTENEREFFARLVAALPEHYVFPQVGMGALIAPASSDRKVAHADRLRVAQQRVDFVICDRSCKVALVIELDDRTHQAGKDQRRDERLQQGGVRTVRFQSKDKPGAQAIREAVSGIAIDRGVTRAPVAA